MGPFETTFAILVFAIFTTLTSVNAYPMTPMTEVYFTGDLLVNGAGTTVYMRGVNLLDGTYCAVENGLWDGFQNQAQINAMQNWGLNTVRLPLNEFCWFDINGVAFGGTQYITALTNYVELLLQNNMAAILVLAVAGPGDTWDPTEAAPMPDLDHANSFWAEVAATFGNYSNVIFDVYDQPFPGNGAFNSTSAWQCWELGGSYCNEGYDVVGMKSLVATIRANTPGGIVPSWGHPRVVLTAGPAYGNSLSMFGSYQIADRQTHQTFPTFHVSNTGDGSHCNNVNCWHQTVYAITNNWPVIWQIMDYSPSGADCIAPITSQGPRFGIVQQDQNMIVGIWDANYNCVLSTLITDWGGSPSSPLGNQFQNIILGEQQSGEY